MKQTITDFIKNSKLRFFSSTSIFLTMLMLSPMASDFTLHWAGNDAKVNISTSLHAADVKALQVTWYDLAFSHFFPVPNTRLADFSDMNLGGMFRVNFMALNIEPLWLSGGLQIQSHHPVTHRIETLTDYNIFAGGGWRFWFTRDMNSHLRRFSFTPRLSYGLLMHVTYGDYYDDYKIYPAHEESGVVKTRYFFDSFFLIEPEFAYDFSSKNSKLQGEVFLAPSFKYYPEKKRDGYEYGYILGVRLKTGEVKTGPEWGIYGNVYLHGTRQPIEGVQVYMAKREPNKVSMLKDATLLEETDSKGNFRGRLEKGTAYTIFLKKEGYFVMRGNFDTSNVPPGWYPIENFIKVKLQEAVPGKKIDFESIYYDSGKWAIRPESMNVLNSMTEFFLDNPNIVVELSAHTDSLGSAVSNRTLSQKRAQSAVDVIIGNGISMKRITAKGYGEEQVQNGCVDGVACTPEQHQENRRTEFKVKDIIKNIDLN